MFQNVPSKGKFCHPYKHTGCFVSQVISSYYQYPTPSNFSFLNDNTKMVKYSSCKRLITQISTEKSTHFSQFYSNIFIQTLGISYYWKTVPPWILKLLLTDALKCLQTFVLNFMEEGVLKFIHKNCKIATLLW